MVVGADAGTHVLVAKSRDDIEKIWPAALGALGRGALSLLGRGGAKAAAGKGAQVGVKGAAGTAGATGAGAVTPAAGATTTALQPASATAGTSMASSSSAQGATQAAPVKVQPSQPAQGGNIFDPYVEPKPTGTLEDYGVKRPEQDTGAGGMKTLVERSKEKADPSTAPEAEWTQSTLDSDDPTLQAAEAESAARVEAEEKAKNKKQMNLNTLMAAGSAAYAPATMVSGHFQRKNAEKQAEQERISRLAEETRAKAGTGTGGKVAVA